MNALYLAQIRDMHSAEKQLIAALPKMAKAATAPVLRDAFTDHLEETRNHLERINAVLEALGEKPGAEKCEAMAGLIEEGKEVIDADAEDHVRDAALIVCAQKVEHYEIASYGSLCTHAKLMGRRGDSKLLGATWTRRRTPTASSPLSPKRRSIRKQRASSPAPRAASSAAPADCNVLFSCSPSLREGAGGAGGRGGAGGWADVNGRPEHARPRARIRRPTPEPHMPNTVTTPDRDPANRDPVSGEPGSHPVGVGVGAAGGAAIGAGIGAVGGPIRRPPSALAWAPSPGD